MSDELIVVGSRQYLVESLTHPDTFWCVSEEFNEETGKDELMCTCEGWGFRRECRHIRVAELYEAGLASFGEVSPYECSIPHGATEKVHRFPRPLAPGVKCYCRENFLTADEFERRAAHPSSEAGLSSFGQETA